MTSYGRTGACVQLLSKHSSSVIDCLFSEQRWDKPSCSHLKVTNLNVIFFRILYYSLKNYSKFGGAGSGGKGVLPPCPLVL